MWTRIISYLLAASLIIGLLVEVAAAQSPGVRATEFNLKSGLALEGYDPVSYQHGGPQKGDPARQLVHQGVSYYFSSAENQEAFAADPARYEPACGGWCAWAMLDGEKVKVNPRSYKVIGGRTYLFYDGLLGDTRKKWNAKGDDPGQAAQVARQWAKIVGR